MLATNLWIPDLRKPDLFVADNPRLLEDIGLIHKAAAGRFSLLPLGALILKRMKDTYRVHMKQSGAIETVFLTMSPSEIWNESGRWESFGPALIKTTLNSGSKVCLNPTHEEVAVAIMKKRLRSYRELPVNMFCIQKVYRDEPRPKSELLRTQEFYMADSYSFHRDSDDADRGYQQMQTVYSNIFRDFELPFLVIQADNGLIGGTRSVEFQFEHVLGESNIVTCHCGYACDSELQVFDAPCPNCGGTTCTAKGVEMAHIFLLETTYSRSMRLRFRDHDNKLIPPHMGCTGIGMTRVLQTLVLHHMHESGITWPPAVAPFDVIISPRGTFGNHVHELMNHLESRLVPYLVDDRSLPNTAKRALIEFLNPRFTISESESSKRWILSETGDSVSKVLNTRQLVRQISHSLSAARLNSLSITGGLSHQS